MCLNHPENIPSSQLSMEKLSSTKSAPGAKKIGDSWLNMSARPILSSVQVATLFIPTPSRSMREVLFLYPLYR